MRVLTLSVLLLAHAPGAALAATATPERPRLEKDACARKSEACEQACDAHKGMERLSCKTDCRLAESQCRNGKR